MTTLNRLGFNFPDLLQTLYSSLEPGIIHLYWMSGFCVIPETGIRLHNS